MVGKFLISMTFAIAYLYTAELFPTNVRNVAVGTASTFARVGSISAPYIVDLLVIYRVTFPGGLLLLKRKPSRYGMPALIST